MDTFLKVFKNISSLQAANQGDESHIVTIGNFDGCHLGHQRLIQSTLNLAAKTSAASLCLTFDPHPKYFFNPDMAPAQLFTIEQKVQAFHELGFKKMLIQPFDASFRATTAEDFYEKFLKQGLNAKGIVIGHNFYFGKDRKGSPEYLQSLAKSDQIELQIISAATYADQTISSTRIRKILQAHGDVSQAWDMLGRPYLLEGRVNSGQRIGRKLGFPTINLHEVRQLHPCNGVYTGFVWLEGVSTNQQPSIFKPNARQLMPAVINIGHRPTLQNDDKVVIEVHLLEKPSQVDEDLLTRRIGIYFVGRIRSEQKFANAEELKQQIERDIQQARHELRLLRDQSLAK